VSHELRIEKEAVAVNLITVGGERFSGHLFVNPFHPRRGGREQPVDILNGPGEYLPLRTADGIILVAKHAIAEVDHAASSDSEDDGSMPVGVRVTLSVTLSSGKAYSGCVHVEGPVNTPRLLDYMNRLAAANDRFVTLYAKKRVRLLNRDHIETIKTTD
jgi:hypothetical protein